MPTTAAKTSADASFSLPSFNGADVDPRIIDVGLILGLLTSPTEAPTDPTTSVNTSWFDGIPAQLAQIPMQAGPLLDLLQRLLGGLTATPPTAGEPDGTSVTPPRVWYGIPYEGNPTPLSVVLPATTADTGNLISLGFSVSKTFTVKTVSATVYVYGVVPVFEVPNAVGSVFVVGQTGSPIELHVTVSAGASTTVNGLQLAGYFTFSAAPTFSLQFLAGTSASGPAYTSLSDLIANDGESLISTVLDVGPCTAFLNQTIGPLTATPGSLLESIGFLTSTGTAPNLVWSVKDLTPFEGSTSAFAMKIIQTILSALASSSGPIIPVPLGQKVTGVYVQAEPDGNGGTDYGFRIAVPALPLQIGSPGTDPTLTVQLGAWLSGEATTPTDTTWWNRAAAGSAVPAEPVPGITVFLLNEDSSNTLSFTGKIELASVGVDFEPAAQQSLVSLGGFTLGGVEARGYVKLDLTKKPILICGGGALMCQQIGLPLGQSFANAGGVTSTVLSAGGAGDPQASQPVNPAFSVSAAFVSGSTTPVAVQFYDASGNTQSPIWMELQRSFGPLTLEKIGASWQDAAGGSPATLTLDIDGGISLGPLDVELTDLSITMPPTAPLDASGYSLGLSGMNISFSSGSVSLDAGLVNTGSQYTGEAAIKAGTFNIGAFGAFGALPAPASGSPSMFVFGWTNTPIGGPPCFFVTGVAAGFGYNRGLNLPTVDQVQQFPFVSALSNASAFGTGSQQDQAAAALGLLVNGNYVPETRGEYWFAAGVQFKSFELVNSSALLAVEFGPDLTIALLGLSIFQLGSIESPYVYVELELDASLKPDDGVLMVLGELTSNSYVLDPACHLTGGFAFGVWFGSNANAGDFVVTVGGYHPLFTPPSYYPAVPRLAISWDVGGGVSIQGDAYFAVTPGCAMAGGGLQAQYQSGNLKAWLDVEADLLVQWRPFYFIADVSISIGVSYKVNLLFVSFTISVQLGAALALWGPPTGGTVEIDWTVISFSIGFGASRGGPDPASWADFVANLLPNQPANSNQQAVRRLGAVAAVTATADAATQTLQPTIDVALTAGMVSQDPVLGWIVRADGLAFTVRSSVPANALTFAAGNSPTPTVGTYKIGIVPLSISAITSTLAVTITASTGQINGTFTAILNTPNLPSALWGQAAPSGPSSTLVALPVGLDVSADPYAAQGIAPIPITTLEYDIIDPTPQTGNDPPPAPLPLSPTATAAAGSGVENTGSLAIMQNTITNASVAAQRNAILSAAADFGYSTGLAGAPTGLAANIPLNLRAPTMLGTPAGVQWPTS